MGFKLVPAGVACATGLVIWFVIPVPEGVAPNAWHLLALFVATIAAIMGKAMPIGALSILAIALVALTRVTNDKPVEAINDALSSFANPLIWLISVAIMISRALIKTGTDHLTETQTRREFLKCLPPMGLTCRMHCAGRSAHGHVACARVSR